MTKAILKYSLYSRPQPTNEITGSSFLPEGTTIEVEKIVEGIPIDRISTWYKSTDGFYYWGGGIEQVKDIPDLLTTAAPAIHFPPFKINWKENFLGLSNDLKQFTGQGIKVAIIDTGVDLSHPDIAPNISQPKDFTQNNGPQVDHVGHGTAIAGIIGANAQNEKGITGVAPGCTIIPLKVLKSKFDRTGLANSVMEAIRFAKQLPVDIINISLDLSDVVTNDLKNLIGQAAGQGIVIIASAGSFDELTKIGVTYPGKDPNVISIGSTDLFFEKSILDARPDRLDFLGGSKDVWTLSNNPEKYTAVSNDSSFCAAFLSGLCALIISSQRARTGTNAPIPRAEMIRIISQFITNKTELFKENLFSFINV